MILPTSAADSTGAHVPDLLPLPEPAGPEPVVAVLVLDSPATFEVGVAAEVFGVRRGEVLRHPRVDGTWYDLRLCAAEPDRALPGPGGTSITLSHGLDDVAAADVVVVPLCAKPADRERLPTGQVDPLPVPEPVLEAIRAAHAGGATVMSFCSGSFALAEAGLLDGQRATTHWMYAAAFRRRFPQVAFAEDVLYVDNGRVLTSAGSASAIDLSLHLVRREHGAEVADLIARRMVVPPHRDGGQAQYVLPPPPEVAATGFGELLDWILGSLGEESLDVEAMAARAAMSPRSFARRFGQATGTTPYRWLTARRVDEARRLLETTDWSVDRVAAACGLGTAANLRARMHEAIGVTPTAYRRRFARAS